MGFFSWLTADTKQSISNNASIRGARPVYLIQPYNRVPICEPSYEGYGIFGGIDAYEWLAKENLSANMLAGLSDDSIRTIGLNLDMGAYYKHDQSGKLYTIFHEIHPVVQAFHGLEIQQLGLTYDAPIRIFDNRSANDMICDRSLVKLNIRKPKIGLKFSFNPKADYKRLRLSKNCPDQGFFYD